MKKIIIALLVSVTLTGCIKTQKQWDNEHGGGIYFMSIEEGKEFDRNLLFVTMDERGYIMLQGNINGNPVSFNLDSLYMQMHNDRTKSYNIYDEKIVKR